MCEEDVRRRRWNPPPPLNPTHRDLDSVPVLLPPRGSFRCSTPAAVLGDGRADVSPAGPIRCVVIISEPWDNEKRGLEQMLHGEKRKGGMSGVGARSGRFHLRRGPGETEHGPVPLQVMRAGRKSGRYPLGWNSRFLGRGLSFLGGIFFPWCPVCAISRSRIFHSVAAPAAKLSPV